LTASKASSMSPAVPGRRFGATAPGQFVGESRHHGLLGEIHGTRLLSYLDFGVGWNVLLGDFFPGGGSVLSFRAEGPLHLNSGEEPLY
jgi:hypothetical protein